MKEQLITFETAKLAKRKGFDIDVYETFVRKETEFKRPTQSLLQRWLREVHNIHVEILYRYYAPIPDYGCGIKTKEGCIASTVVSGKIPLLFAITLNPHPAYEEALEAGLLKALDLAK